MSEAQLIVDLIVAAAVFVLVLSLAGLLVLVRYMHSQSRDQRFAARLGLKKDEEGETQILHLWHEGAEAATTVPGKGKKPSIRVRMERILKSAGLKVPLRTALIGLSGGAAGVCLIMFVLTRSWIAATSITATGLIVVRTFIVRRSNRLTALFEMQLVDALDLATRSLQAGHPPLSAFRIISENIAPPVGHFFAEICQQQALGVNLEEAIRNIAEAYSSPDVSIFAASVAIQRRSGGNLSPTMERLALVIRDRIKLSRRVRVLTAQTQLSKWILLGLPVMLFVLLSAVNPGYMHPLYSTGMGRLLLLAAGLGTLLGAWVMNRLATIRY